MRTTITKGGLRFCWIVTAFLMFFSVLNLFNEGRSVTSSLFIFVIFGIVFFLTLSLQKTVLVFNDEGIFLDKFYTKKSMTWSKITQILLDHDNNVKFISNTDVLYISLSQYRKQGEVLGRIHQYAAEKIVKTIYRVDAAEIARINQLKFYIPLTIILFLLFRDVITLISLVIGIISGLQRVSKLLKRSYMKNTIVDKFFTLICFLPMVLVITKNNVLIDYILKLLIVVVAYPTGLILVYAIFKNRIENMAQKMKLEIN